MSRAIVVARTRAFHDAARTSRPVHRHRYSHVEGRCLLAGLGSAAASGPRGRRRLSAQGPLLRSPSGSGSHRPGNCRHYSGSSNRRHRATRSGSHCHRSHLPGVHRRVRSRTTAIIARAVANESGWGVKN
jgi:hypothetical protein